MAAKKLSAVHALSAPSKAKAAKFKRAVKHLVNIRRTSDDTKLPNKSSSLAHLSRRPRSLRFLRQLHHRNNAIQHLSVRQAIPMQDELTTQNSHCAFQFATTIVAILLSFVLIAKIMFLPFRILAVQGIPLFLTMAGVLYLLVQSLEQIESELDKIDGEGDLVVESRKLRRVSDCYVG